MSKITKEFSRFAHHYDQYNMIQLAVAKRLVGKLSHNSYGSVLDIGSGSGQILKSFEAQNISYESFTALDASSEMLTLHPKSNAINTVCADFNTKTFLTSLERTSYDLIISSSALQWSRDLECTLKQIASHSDRLVASVFTSGTFKTLHEVAGITSPIYDTQVLQEVFSKIYNNVTFEEHRYTLHFDATREMFRYIKKSGVSSGEKKLSVKETKRLMRDYPLGYLEFEVLFIEARNE